MSRYVGLSVLVKYYMTIGKWACQLTNGASLANGVVQLANKPIGRRSVIARAETFSAGLFLQSKTRNKQLLITQMTTL
jgi:hypothetical protein